MKGKMSISDYIPTDTTYRAPNALEVAARVHEYEKNLAFLEAGLDPEVVQRQRQTTPMLVRWLSSFFFYFAG